MTTQTKEDKREKRVARQLVAAIERTIDAAEELKKVRAALLQETERSQLQVVGAEESNA